MASVEKRARAGRITWLARWRDPAGRSLRRSFRRKVDADRFLGGIEESMRVGTYVDPAAGHVALGQWSRQWLQGQGHLAASTRARYEGILQRHILPAWGNVPLARISHSDVAAWTGGLTATGLAPGTVRYIHRVLSLMLELAVRDGRLARNPATGVRLPTVRAPEKRFLTHEQVASLADAAGAHRLEILVLAYTGLRWGELAALKVGRLDLMRRRITVAESVTEVRGKLTWGDPKSHQTRSVPLPRFLVDDLAQHVAGKPADALVFTGTKGGVLRNLNFRRDCFDHAACEAGLRGLTPHELRHTAASLAVSAGANVKSVQRMLGHASAAMTLDVYSGLFDDDLDAVADRLDGAARDAAVPPVCPEAVVTPITERETGS